MFFASKRYKDISRFDIGIVLGYSGKENLSIAN
jgi:hypothetical protein